MIAPIGHSSVGVLVVSLLPLPLLIATLEPKARRRVLAILSVALLAWLIVWFPPCESLDGLAWFMNACYIP